MVKFKKYCCYPPQNKNMYLHAIKSEWLKFLEWKMFVYEWPFVIHILPQLVRQFGKFSSILVPMWYQKTLATLLVSRRTSSNFCSALNITKMFKFFCVTLFLKMLIFKHCFDRCFHIANYI
jgi:hypothetical protein